MEFIAFSYRVPIYSRNVGRLELAGYADSVRGSSYTNAAITLEGFIWRGTGRNIRKVLTRETAEGAASVVTIKVADLRSASLH